MKTRTFDERIIKLNDGMLIIAELEYEHATSRWIAEVHELPGVIVYGTSVDDALTRVKNLATKVLAENVK